MLQGMWDLSRKGITLVSPSLAVRFLNDPARKPKKVNFYSKFVECFIIIKYLILLNTFSVYIGWFLCVGRGHLFFYSTDIVYSQYFVSVQFNPFQIKNIYFLFHKMTKKQNLYLLCTFSFLWLVSMSSISWFVLVFVSGFLLLI